MSKYANPILILILTVLAMTVQLVKHNNEFYLILYYFIYTIILWWLLLNIKPKINYIHSIQNLFKKGKGSIIIDKEKLIELNESTLAIRIFINKDENQRVLKYFIFASASSPVMTLYLFKSMGISNQINLFLIFFMSIFYLVFSILIIITYFIIKKFNQETIESQSTLIEKIEDKIIISTNIHPSLLVKNTDQKYLRMELDVDHLDEIKIIQPQNKGKEKINEYGEMIEIKHSISLFNIIFINQLQIDINSEYIKVIDKPKYLHEDKIKYCYIFSSVDIMILRTFLDNLIYWARN